MKAVVIFTLVVGAIVQVAGLVGKGLGAQQSAATEASHAYQDAAR